MRPKPLIPKAYPILREELGVALPAGAKALAMARMTTRTQVEYIIFGEDGEDLLDGSVWQLFCGLLSFKQRDDHREDRSSGHREQTYTSAHASENQVESFELS